MRRFAGVVVGAASLAAMPSAAVAGEGKTDKATGGGQVLVGDGERFSTLAFTAQNTEEGGSAGKGPVQFKDRTNNTKFHGVVDCVIVEGNRAQIAGFRKKADDPSDPGSRFELTVVDNGEPNQGRDMVLFDNSSIDGRCETDDSDEQGEPELALARGNAQVRDGDPANNFEEQSGMAALTDLLGL